MTRSLNVAAFYRTFRNLIAITGIVILTIDIFLSQNVANAEYFSSVDSLQKLGDVEIGLVKIFRDYLDMQEREFESYRKFIEHVKLQHSIAIEDVEDYLGNPINAFTLIKRMVTDWNYLHEFIKQSQARSEFRETLENFHKQQKIPEENELKGAVQGFARLQKTYNLKVEDVANGKINGVDFGTTLNWHDCFEIASNLFDQKEHKLALDWFEIALEKLREIDNDKGDPIQRKFEIETLEYLGLTNYELGNSEKAIEFIDELLDLEPNHHIKDVRLYILYSPPKQPKPLNDRTDASWFKNYTQLCQGNQLPEKKLRKLKCRIDNRNNPRLILAPLRVEELNKDPPINLYHGLLTDKQINQIILEAETKMQRSSVIEGNGSKVSDVRISQQAWLDYRTPVMSYIYHVVGDITGLTLTNAEIMQMANYGIAGQYEPHYDFLGVPPDHVSNWIGDRMTTNMFYLSNVELGGSTVFPKLNVYSKPIKGAMVSWFNQHKSVDPDYRTLHAGCPVVKGSKRIGNVWIRSGRQEFLRPCALQSDSFKSVGYM